MWEGYFDRDGPLHGLPQATREHRFHTTRKWRMDRAYPEFMTAVEVEGGIWSGGRHVRGAGYEGDCEKYNQAQIMGWAVLRFTPKQVISGYCWDTIESALRSRGWKGEP